LIPQTNIETDSWQTQLRDVIRSDKELLRFVQLRPDQLDHSHLAGKDFPIKVPRAFASRMVRGDPNDPLLRQVLSSVREMDAVPGFTRDPVGETGAVNPQAGVIQKYHGRALLMLTGSCAINCRYCFRRHFPYAENRNSRQQWLETLEYVASDSSITEVILSGGDPLLVDDSQLAELVGQLTSIGHVKRLRIHTRLPIVIPERVTRSLLNALTDTPMQAIVVLHSNHANELDGSVASAMQAMSSRGITLLNQAVLLAGVNDNAEALLALSERLFAIGVLPYYLHLLDKVQGAAHFDVPESRAIDLIDAISAGLPGYLVPALVREVAGEPAKVRVYTAASAH